MVTYQPAIKVYDDKYIYIDIIYSWLLLSIVQYEESHEIMREIIQTSESVQVKGHLYNHQPVSMLTKEQRGDRNIQVLRSLTVLLWINDNSQHLPVEK